MSAAVSAALEFAERSPASTRTRVITWQDPLPTAAAGAELAGLDYMRTAAAADLPPPPIAVLLRMAPVEIEDGRVVFEGEPGEEHYNPIGVVHGGYAATLLDSAIGCAVHTTLPAGVGYSTLTLEAKFVQAIPARPGSSVARPRSCIGAGARLRRPAGWSTRARASCSPTAPAPA